MTPVADGVGPLAGPKRIGLRPGRPFVHRLPVGSDERIVGVGNPPGARLRGAASLVISGPGGAR
jgi:hypothetical protein